MQKLRNLAIINLLLLLVQVALSYATQYKLVNVLDVGEVSDRYPSLFTPAGFTFAIWGVIYTALLAFCIRHIVLAFAQPSEHPGNGELENIGGWFAANNIFTIAWLLTWTNGYIGIATILIVLQLLSLIVIHSRLGIHNRRQATGSKILTQFPLSIYLGWIMIATIANTAIYFVAIGEETAGLSLSPINWTRILIAGAVLITVLVVFAARNVAVGLVTIWALWGIISKRREEGADTYASLIETAWLGIGVVASACLAQFVRNITRSRRYRKQQARFPESIHPVK